MQKYRIFFKVSTLMKCKGLIWEKKLFFKIAKKLFSKVRKKVYFCKLNRQNICPGGGIGRRVGLKNQ
jgi:hypothetical protein